MNMSQEKLKSVCTYDPDTGVFLKKTGGLLGRKRSNGYWVCSLNGEKFYLHRLAFLYVEGEPPKEVVDHINGDPSDNRFCNLRKVTQSENMQNLTRPHKDNKSGFLGVHWSNFYSTWIAQISIKGKRITLGRFETAEKASKAYLIAKKKFHIQGGLIDSL